MSSSDGGKRASKGLGENGDGVTGLGWARRVKDEAQEMVMVLEEKWSVVEGTWVG